MKIIGLCGGSGSGKGTVAGFFKKYGVAHIDTDAVYHGIISHPSPCVSEVAARFGRSVINSDGGLDRGALGGIVFTDESHRLLSELGEITHKHILKETTLLIEHYRDVGAAAVIIDAPLLFESGFNALCDAIVAVTAPVDIRVSRIIARDKITEEAARRRIASQMPDERLCSLADYVIENIGDPSDAEVQVGRIVKDILK